MENQCLKVRKLLIYVEINKNILEIHRVNCFEITIAPKLNQKITLQNFFINCSKNKNEEVVKVNFIIL